MFSKILFLLLLLGQYAQAQQTPACTSTINFIFDSPIGIWQGDPLDQPPVFVAQYKAYTDLAFPALATVYNSLNAAGTFPVYGVKPLFGLVHNYTDGLCTTINLIPKLRLKYVNYGNDSNVMLNSLLSAENCPQVVTGIHTTLNASILFSAMTLTCNGYGVPTLAYLLEDNSFTNKQNYPLNADTGLSYNTSVTAIFHFLARYEWKRMAVLYTAASGIYEQIASSAQFNGVTLADIPLFNGNVATSCATRMDLIQQGQWKIIYVGPYTSVVDCVVEFARRNMSADNYILLFSFEFIVEVPQSTMQGLITLLHSRGETWITAQHFIGSFIITTPVIITPQVGARFFRQLALNTLATGVWNTTSLPPGSIYSVSMSNSFAIAEQGIVGMLGARAETVLASVALNTSNNASEWALSFLSAFSTTTLDPSLVSIAPPVVSGSSAVWNVNVQFGAIGFDGANIFYHYTNASGAYSASATANVVTMDPTGFFILDITISNWNGTQTNLITTYQAKSGTYISNAMAVVWPNNASLHEYANGWPADQAPPTNIQFECEQVCDQWADNQLTLPWQEPSASFYQNPIIAIECDGTLPVLLNVNIVLSSGLWTYSSFANTAPFILNPTNFTLVVQQLLLQQYLSQWLSQGIEQLINDTTVISQQKDGTFQLQLPMTCSNGANTISQTLQISVQSPSQTYVPSSSQQQVVIAFNALGMALVIALIAIVTWNRDQRVIYSSAVSFLVSILIGHFILFLSSILTILPATEGYCISKVVTFHTGWVLVLGSVFIKTFRLHAIFNSKKIKSFSISTLQLFGGLVVIWIVHMVPIILWVAPAVGNGERIESSTQQACITAGASNLAYPLALTVLAGLELQCGSYLTHKIRTVPFAFNESRYLGWILYFSSTLAFFYILFCFGALSFSTTASLLVFTSWIIFVGNLLSCVILFGPKMWALRQEVNSEPLPSTSAGHRSISSARKDSPHRAAVHSAKSVMDWVSSSTEKWNQQVNELRKQNEALNRESKKVTTIKEAIEKTENDLNNFACTEGHRAEFYLTKNISHEERLALNEFRRLLLESQNTINASEPIQQPPTQNGEPTPKAAAVIPSMIEMGSRASQGYSTRKLVVDQERLEDQVTRSSVITPLSPPFAPLDKILMRNHI